MLQDNFGRKFQYLRLSITDVCNYSCNYCLPDGYQKDKSACHTSTLSLSEIKKLVRAFSELGTEKIRITGGEPAVRKDLCEIIEICKSTPNIKKVAITTNGYQLDKNIEQWVEAGLDSLNVSIDSLDPRMFQAITGHDRLDEILRGLEKAQQLDVPNIKVNSVLMRQFNQQEINHYLAWLKDKKITLRLIELMQTGDNKEFFLNNHVSGESIKQDLIAQGWIKVITDKLAGPAEEFHHPEFAGRIGLIMPYSKDFCNSCNRLRLSSKGNLHLCLFGEQGYPLRKYCESDDPEVIKTKIIEYLGSKKASHFLHSGATGSTRHLAMLGG